MKAAWHKFDGQLTEAKTVVATGTEVLDGEWQQGGTAKFTPERHGEQIAIDLGFVGAPLGKYWDTLYQRGEHTVLRDALRRYWQHTEVPTFSIDLISGKDEETGTETQVLLRTKVVAPKTSVDDRLARIVAQMRNPTLGVDRVVVGNQGDHAELQFLSKRFRGEIKSGDTVDCGLFVSLNGTVNVAAGINRLVCTNGLIRRLDAWTKEDFSFDGSYFDRAQELFRWLQTTVDKKVHHTREISVVLDLFPKTFVSRFWKRWSEAVELKELTWFQVIDDLTHAVNGTLGDLRYRTLAIPDRIDGYAGRCHACSAEIERQ